MAPGLFVFVGSEKAAGDRTTPLAGNGFGFAGWMAQDEPTMRC
jgi:hypothetical protein